MQLKRYDVSAAVRSHGRAVVAEKQRRRPTTPVPRQPQASLSHGPNVQHVRKSRPAPRKRLVATAAAAGPQEKSPVGAVLGAVYLLGLFSVWYMSNIYFNIYNKQVLVAFPFPLTCTLVHLVVSSCMAALLWVSRIKPVPRITPNVLDIMFPLGLLHMIGFWTTNASLGSVAVSLTHTIKALEPFFTVMLSWLLMGVKPARRVLLAIVPIVLGVVIASATDVSFNWLGFNAAMLSNVAFQARNVLSKKAMLRTSYLSLEGGDSEYILLDEVNIFALMSMAAMLLLAPIVGLLDWPSLASTYSLRAPSDVALVMSGDLWIKLVLAGVCRFGDVLASFLILQKVIPVTHSVGNCVKRVVVIAASIVFFRTPASFMNILGTAVALGGVLTYTFVKRLSKDSLDVEKVTGTDHFANKGLCYAVKTTVLEDAFLAVSPGTLYLKTRAALGIPVTVKQEKPSDDQDLEYYL